MIINLHAVFLCSGNKCFLFILRNALIHVLVVCCMNNAIDVLDIVRLNRNMFYIPHMSTKETLNPYIC